MTAQVSLQCAQAPLSYKSSRVPNARDAEAASRRTYAVRDGDASARAPPSHAPLRVDNASNRNGHAPGRGPVGRALRRAAARRAPAPRFLTSRAGDRGLRTRLKAWARQPRAPTRGRAMSSSSALTPGHIDRASTTRTSAHPPSPPSRVRTGFFSSLSRSLSLAYCPHRPTAAYFPPSVFQAAQAHWPRRPMAPLYAAAHLESRKLWDYTSAWGTCVLVDAINNPIIIAHSPYHEETPGWRGSAPCWCLLVGDKTLGGRVGAAEWKRRKGAREREVDEALGRAANEGT